MKSERNAIGVAPRSRGGLGWLAWGILCAGLAAACARSAEPQRERAPLADSAQRAVLPCGQAEGMECFETRRQACTAATRVWNFSFTMASQGKQPYEFHVSESGLLRMDHQGKRLFGVDASLWLSCMDQCPGSDLGAACIPYSMPFHLSYRSDETCTERVEAAEPWMGLESKQIQASCEDGSSMSIRLVPALRPLRDALVAVGAIPADNQLARFDGLPVTIEMGGQTVLSMSEAREADCSVFAYPEGHRMFASAADFAALARMYPALEQELETQGRTLSAQVQEEALRSVEPQLLDLLGRLCLGERASYQESEVEQCLEAKPELVPEAQSLVQNAIDEAMAAVIRSITGDMEPTSFLIQKMVDEPLCQHFASPGAAAE